MTIRALRGDIGSVNALQQLIQAWLDAERGRSLRDLAAKSGFRNASTVHALMARDRPAALPRRTTLDKLARGLGVPLGVVQAAAQEAAGFRVEAMSGSPEMKGWLALLDELPPERREELWEIASMMLRRMKDAP